MDWTHTAAVLFVVGVCLPGGSTAVTAQSTGSPVAAADSAESNATEPIVERTAVRLSADDPGTITADITYEIPETVSWLTFRVETTPHVVETDGFERVGDRTFEWTGTGTRGHVTLRYPAGEGFYLDERYQKAVGNGSGWAIAVKPETNTRWVANGTDTNLTYEFTAGGGTAGENLAVLGPHEIRETTVAGQYVRLVVPETTDPMVDPQAVLRSVEAAAGYRFGGADSVLLIVAPTRDVYWDPRALSVGPDARIAGDQRTDRRVNNWVHEYVHSQQNRAAVTDETRWLVEGSAEYYGALVNFRRGQTDFRSFRRVLKRGTYDGVDDAVLAEPRSWQGTDADYVKGALVVAMLDRRIRAATDGRATFAAVMRRWARAEEFDARAFEGAVGSVAGPEVRAVAETYTRTDATPELPNETAYSAVLESSRRSPTTSSAPGSPPASVTVTASDRSRRRDPATSTAAGDGFGVVVTLLAGVLLVRRVGKP